MNPCKICGDALTKILTYTAQPKTAQFLSTNEDDVDKRGISFDVCQCVACGVVQIPLDPVYYYHTAISSSPWSTDPFRVEQYERFVNEFGLQGKNIKRITNEPRQEKYNAFLMFNYLEHFPEPIKILKQLFSNLDEPGVGIIEVPNFDDIIKNRIFGEFIIDHLFYFTEQTLRLVCELGGFEVLRIEEVWEGASLSATVRKRKPLSGTSFRDNEKQLIADMDDFISNYDSVAIYGAGHQTLMMLPMLQNIDKVSYIVDDFQVKHNTFTDVKTKMIVSREHLAKNPVDAVIIIVGWQYNHVLQAISKMQLKSDLALIKKATLERLKVERS
jgi:hypothetical protein